MAEITLEHVLESNELVLVDGCVKSGVNIKGPILNMSDFSFINKGVLKDQKKGIRKFLDILSHPNVLTLPEVTDEIRKFHDILRLKSGYLGYKNRKKHREARHVKNKELFESLEQMALDLYHACRQSELRISDTKYELLFEMIKIIDDTMDLRKRKSDEYGKSKPNTDTDIRIIAALYYISLVQDISPALLSGDNHFRKLLGVPARVLLNERFSPYNQQLTEAVIRNPPIFYFSSNQTNNGIERVTLDSVYKMKSRHLQPEEFKEMDDELMPLFERLSEESKAA